ncbi:MAG TPA: FecR domain-containing protein [Opitutaceae bacterium]|nr:FecR domain-containing protein [Opitutaceae bacterium]
MSPHSPSSRPSPPDAIEAEAARWLSRRDAGLDATETGEFTAWRERDPRHDEAVRRLEALADALRRARQRGAMGRVQAGLEVRARRRHHRRLALAGAGAAALLALVTTFSVRRSLRVAPAPVPAEPVRSVAIIRHLADGSVVELSRTAELTVHFDSHFRRVELRRGEALFHVAHDTAHPFIVRAGGVDVRAVGTAFAVRLDPRTVEVLVTEGKVGLDNAAAGRSLLPRAPDGQFAPLTAGERAVVATANPEVAAISRIDPAEMARRLAWRAPRVQYDGIELAAVVAQLNRRNSVHIILADDAIGRLRISGSFPADNPDVFARLAAETFGLTCERRENGEIVLRRP